MAENAIQVEVGTEGAEVMTLKTKVEVGKEVYFVIKVDGLHVLCKGKVAAIDTRLGARPAGYQDTYHIECLKDGIPFTVPAGMVTEVAAQAIAMVHDGNTHKLKEWSASTKAKA